jgi:tetratricopeptide (TPR) repeat protein
LVPGKMQFPDWIRCRRGWWAVFLFAGVVSPLPTASQTNPLSFDSLVSEASAAREQNDVPHAMDLYSQALQIDPKWADGWWFLGGLQYGSGAYAQARDSLSHYIELTPTPGPAIALRGLCEFETGGYALALLDIQQGISLGAATQSRNEQILRYHEAAALTRLGRFQDALKSYSFFVERNITSPELMVSIGLAGLRMALLPKDVPPDQEPLVAAAGSAAFQSMAGDEEGSQKAFEDLFRRFPAARNAHYLYGYLLFNTDADAALSEFRKELELMPSNTEAAIMAARILLLRKRAAEALPLAQTAAHLEPGSAIAELVLGRALLETGNLSGSIEHLERALRLEPNNLEVHIGLAKSYSKSGRKDDARRERMRCLELTQVDASTSANP